jgi:hypothetical protein
MRDCEYEKNGAVSIVVQSIVLLHHSLLMDLFAF